MDRVITIQNIDDRTARRLSEEVKRRGVSVNTLVLQLVREGIGLDRGGPQRQVYHDLDALAGTWSDEETTEFLNSLADFGRVDESLWR